MKQQTREEILSMFGRLDGEPEKYGDPHLHPVYVELCEMHRKHGDDILEPLREAISETTYRDAATSGISFLGFVPKSAQYLADIAVSHPDSWYRGRAIDSLVELGERDTIHDILDKVPEKDRKNVSSVLIHMDAEAIGSSYSLVSCLLHGRYPKREWEKSKTKMGKEKSLGIVNLVRDHPQLPGSIRSKVNEIALGLTRSG